VVAGTSKDTDARRWVGDPSLEADTTGTFTLHVMPTLSLDQEVQVQLERGIAWGHFNSIVCFSAARSTSETVEGRLMSDAARVVVIHPGVLCLAAAKNPLSSAPCKRPSTVAATADLGLLLQRDSASVQGGRRLQQGGEERNLAGRNEGGTLFKHAPRCTQGQREMPAPRSTLATRIGRTSHGDRNALGSFALEEGVDS
jgi:hypothetical protein